MNEEVQVGEVEKDVNVKPDNNIPKELPTKITDLDRMNIELMKSHRREALANAKAAVAEQEKLEVQYQMMVQQLFSKYGLGAQDRVDDSGNIIRGGSSV